MIRLVVDPGVLVSAAIKPTGTPAQLLKAIIDGAADLVVSPRLLAELRAVLLRPAFRRYASEEQVDGYVRLLLRVGIMEQDAEPSERISRDAGDDYLIALARAARAVAIVSGDKDLTTLRNLSPPVLTPRQALIRLRVS